MAKGKIILAWRKVFRADLQLDPTEMQVFQQVKMEYRMQRQLFDPAGEQNGLRDLLARVPGAEKLHYLAGIGAVDYLRGLQEIMPDLKDARGQLFLPFTQYRFELLEAEDPTGTDFSFALHFYSRELCWLDTIGERLLFSLDPAPEGPCLTHLLPCTGALSIYQYQP